MLFHDIRSFDPFYDCQKIFPAPLIHTPPDIFEAWGKRMNANPPALRRNVFELIWCLSKIVSYLDKYTFTLTLKAGFKFRIPQTSEFLPRIWCLRTLSFPSILHFEAP